MRWLLDSDPAVRWQVAGGRWDCARSAGVKPDERVADAIDLVQTTRDDNGHWPLRGIHFERVSFDMELGVGQASRWNTLRALRVLNWYRD